jgi:hypothetical protein
LNSFSETWGFDRKLNGGYAYTQNATIQFVSGSQNLFAIGAAQSLARTLFTGSNLGLAFYPGFSNKQGKRYITESYNLITNECTFQSTFEFDNNLGAYSATYTNSVQLDEQGVITTVENGNIRGIENPNYQIALTAVVTEMTGSYLRCSGAANVYFPTGAILITSPVSQGRSIDIFSNNIDYTVTFNNSPTNQRSYFWDYSLQASKQDGVSTVTEQGSIVGRGENETIAFNNARAGFTTVKAGIAARCAARFVVPYNPAPGYLEDKNESFAPVKSSVGYSYTYSNDPTLRANVGVRRMDTSVQEGHPVYSWNKIGIFNNSEVIQNDYQASQGVQTVNVRLEGDKTVGLSTMLTLATVEVNANAPAGLDRYVGAAEYSYDINQNTTDVSVTWRYNLFTSPTNFPS